MGHMKGQGATEYLVLLAVVLIIALVSIALLGFFPGMASDAKITQSASYWRGEARPVAILESSIVGSSGVGKFVIQNVDASGTIKLNLSVNTALSTASDSLAPGETKTITITDATKLAGTAGNVYDYPISITYISSNGLAMTQYGAKNLMGKYT
jgi:hypothetical protein